MMEAHLCLSSRPNHLSRWKNAFPEGKITDNEHRLLKWLNDKCLVWVHIDQREEADLSRISRLLVSSLPGCRMIAISSNPEPAMALLCLKSGMAGYCHALAAPAFLQQVGQVVSNGGYWLGETLIQRLIETIEPQLATAEEKRPSPQLEKLSPREQQVALQVCKGASNREISRSLSISERTVKAHLGTIFSKLEIRDRLQLVLLLQ